MTIFTQDEVFVNYDNITKIQCYGDVIEDEKIGSVDVAVFKASLVGGKKVVLGYYAEVEQFEEVMKDFTQWLNEKNDYKLVFKMPAQGVQTGSRKDGKVNYDFLFRSSCEFLNR